MIPGAPTPLMWGGGDPLDELGKIDRSLRFRSSAGGKLNKTFGASGNRKTWTLHVWAKRAKIQGAGSAIPNSFLLGSGVGVQDYSYCGFGNNWAAGTDNLQMNFVSGNAQIATLQTTRQMRDIADFVALTFVADTTNATAGDRLRLYVEDNRETSFTAAVYPAQNTDLPYINTTTAQGIGELVANAGYTFEGEMAFFCFVDGQALAPTAFGQRHARTGQWRPKGRAAIKALADAGSANSYFLPFDDPTNLTTLCADASSKGNNWTATNISLTAGATYDSLIDTPTTGYCVLNALKAGIAPVNGALALIGATAHKGALGTLALPTNSLIYFEGKPAVSSQRISLGIATEAQDVTTIAPQASYRGIYGDASFVAVYNGASLLFNLSAVVSTDIYQIAINTATGNGWLGRNNTWYDAAGGTTGNPATGTNPTWTGLTATFYPLLGCYDTTNPVSINFGQQTFAYAPPSGFRALCKKNLAVPTNSVVISPKTAFDVKLRAGTSAVGSLTGLAFKPDLVWTKVRSRADNHTISDSVRGVNGQLFSSLTNAEQITATWLTSFNNDGYSFAGQVSGFGDTNASGQTYVDWLWKASGAIVANNAGSIASQVSANTQAGISVVAYTGTGANATVGHGLGVAPKMVIVKSRSAGSTGWPVYHAANTAAGAMYMHATSAYAADSTAWNGAAPTTTAFSVGTNGNINVNGQTQVAYCFAEVDGFSKFGSYVGNGSADGPFVNCGFRPKFLIIKCANVATDWYMWDSVRNSYNQVDLMLRPNISAAELQSGTYDFDFVANGFKVRGTGVEVNTNGNTYTFAAFAEFPFRYANAR